MPLRLLTLNSVPIGCVIFWLAPGPVTTPPAAPLGVAGEYCPEVEEYVSTCPFEGAVNPTGTL